MADQLTLGIRFRDENNFSNFLPGDNQEAVASLHDFITDSAIPYIYIWGPSGVGKSHLLQACCLFAHEIGLSSFYLPLQQMAKFSPEVLEGLEEGSLIAIDNIETIAGLKEWEEALFHFFNRCMQNNARLIIAGHNIIQELAIKLADLSSRLASGITYHIKAMTDDQKLAALQLRASKRGLTFSEELGKYLLSHYSRDPRALFDCLEIIDEASLKAKHRLTVPFIKACLEASAK